MNLENTLVDETSRTQWPQVVGFHLYGKYTKSKSTETKSRQMVQGLAGPEGQEVSTNVKSISFVVMKVFRNLTVARLQNL